MNMEKITIMTSTVRTNQIARVIAVFEVPAFITDKLLCGLRKPNTLEMYSHIARRAENHRVETDNHIFIITIL